jgi:pimeloyl-ACP methyl ester carboxylesterase
MTAPTKVMEPMQWAVPPTPVACEVLSRLPARPTAKPPLLFVHGLSHGAWCWDEHWMPAAAERGWPCYAISYRGHGGSDGHDRIRRWKLRDYEHDVMQAVIDLPSPPVLIGHSMGALVVRRVLARYPAPAAVLVTPAGAGHGLSVLARLARRDPLNALRAVTLQSVRLDRRHLFSGLDPADAERHERRLTAESPLAQLEITLAPRPARAHGPVLVLGAGDDALVPPHDVVRTARSYGTIAHLFRGMGHDVMLEPRWPEPLTLMLDWLDEQLEPATV